MKNDQKAKRISMTATAFVMAVTVNGGSSSAFESRSDFSDRWTNLQEAFETGQLVAVEGGTPLSLRNLETEEVIYQTAFRDIAFKD